MMNVSEEHNFLCRYTCTKFNQDLLSGFGGEMCVDGQTDMTFPLWMNLMYFVKKYEKKQLVSC